MSKVAMSSTKYVISGEFRVDTVIEKPDLIGAFFGQTEGLIGDELEFQNLQKTGKLGRIEIDLKKKNQKSHGSFVIPTALDKVEVSLVAAALESISKIGHSEGSVKITKIEDKREEKRKIVLKRAEELLDDLKKTLPSSSELEGVVQDNVSAKSIVKCFNGWSGPNLKSQNEVILVEGRADVLLLLRHGISNVVSFEGRLDNRLTKLLGDKIITAFLDGDRVAKLHFENLKEKLDIDYLVYAPEGREVEELSYKEIIKCLKNKNEIEKEERGILKKVKSIIEKLSDIDKQEIKSEEGIIKTRKNYREEEKRKNQNKEKSNYLTKKQYDKIDIVIKEILKNNHFVIFDKKFRILVDKDKKDLFEEKVRGYILVFNGVCENRVLRKARELNIELIVCKRRNKNIKSDIKIKLFEEFTNY